MNWDAEIEKIQARWAENQTRIEQTSAERDEVIKRYDQQLAVLYTEGVNLNGEARFARRMKDEQEQRRALQETSPANNVVAPDVPTDAATPAADDDATESEATTDIPSPTPPDTAALPSPRHEAEAA